jgi:hypothetical protein
MFHVLCIPIHGVAGQLMYGLQNLLQRRELCRECCRDPSILAVSLGEECSDLVPGTEEYQHLKDLNWQIHEGKHLKLNRERWRNEQFKIEKF